MNTANASPQTKTVANGVNRIIMRREAKATTNSQQSGSTEEVVAAVNITPINAMCTPHKKRLFVIVFE